MLSAATNRRHRTSIAAARAPVLLLSALSLASCQSSEGDPNGRPEAGAADAAAQEDANLVLYVTNQSFAMSPVDIRVAIDGDVVVDQSFDVGSQHTFVRFPLEVDAGEHEIVASARGGEVTARETFTIDRKLWGVVEFWYYPPDASVPTPPSVNIRFSEEPFQFQ